jgi:FMN-dependent oxidoreductase (nitrilotriacetate monooxygenase family)
MTYKGKRQIKLGSFLIGPGANIAAWRHHSTPANAPVNLEFIKEVARTAEAGKFDFLFNGDSAYITRDSTPYFLSRFEPITALSALAACTTHIGLAGTFSTSYSEPFTTARQLASLDKISGGRAGWNAVTSALEGVARNHGHDKLHEHALRYRIASEYIDVVKGLWDSWEDDAFVRNKESGQYVDFDKMHTLDHQGEFFKVQGPLNMERSPQGRPVVFQAGASDTGRELAAREADAVFSNHGTHTPLSEAREFYADIKRRAAKYSRASEDILIMPSITPILGSTQAEADRKYAETSAYLDIDLAVKYLGRFFSFFNFSQFALDQPLPDLGDIGKDSFRSTAEYYKRIAREENLTLRQLALRAANPKGEFVGTPETVADRMQELFEARAVDGFIIYPHLQTEGLRDFVDQVVPILRRRGLFRSDYESDTLRGNLGLSYPENRYTAARKRPEQAA